MTKFQHFPNTQQHCSPCSNYPHDACLQCKKTV